MVPILLAAAVWGREWSGKAVRCHCDNSAVVSAVNSGWCREKHLMHLLRCLFFFAAHYRFRISAQHIPGADNVRADALSRGRISQFFSLSQAEPNPNPTPFPHCLLELAADNNIDWTSPHWTEMFRNSLTTASVNKKHLSVCSEPVSIILFISKHYSFSSVYSHTLSICCVFGVTGCKTTIDQILLVRSQTRPDYSRV